MKRKILCPWKVDTRSNVPITGEYQTPIGYTRPFIDGKMYSGMHIWRSVIGNPYLWYHVASKSSFSTAQEAMDHIDELLLKKGYIFLTDEQAEKLAVLL